MISPLHTYKSQVEQAFSQHAGSYDKYAGLQAHAAECSAQILAAVKSRMAIPDGEILEIGCGTGIFSSQLLQLFPNRKIICSDISEVMLDACRLRLRSEAEAAEQVDFQNLDAEYLEAEPQYALIASSFALQWFFEPMEGLTRLFSTLKPGGILVFSVPGAGSCPEWKAAAQRMDVPYTRNPMPSTIELQRLAIRNGMEFRLNDHYVKEYYPDAITMLRSIKELGAKTQRDNLQLSCSQLRRLMNELDKDGKPLVTNYQVIAGYFRKALA